MIIKQITLTQDDSMDQLVLVDDTNNEVELGYSPRASELEALYEALISGGDVKIVPDVE